MPGRAPGADPLRQQGQGATFGNAAWLWLWPQHLDAQTIKRHHLGCAGSTRVASPGLLQSPASPAGLAAAGPAGLN